MYVCMSVCLSVCLWGDCHRCVSEWFMFSEWGYLTSHMWQVGWAILSIVLLPLDKSGESSIWFPDNLSLITTVLEGMEEGRRWVVFHIRIIETWRLWILVCLYNVNTFHSLIDLCQCLQLFPVCLSIDRVFLTSKYRYLGLFVKCVYIVYPNHIIYKNCHLIQKHIVCKAKFQNVAIDTLQVTSLQISHILFCKIILS